MNHESDELIRIMLRERRQPAISLKIPMVCFTLALFLWSFL